MPTSVFCHVCTDALTPTSFATCDICSNDFHLNQRSDIEGRDCGMVWINEEHLGLEFACNGCLEPAVAPGSINDVLDIDEAAALAGIGRRELEIAAEAGQLRHRKTSSGIYLFERDAVIAFANERQG